MQEFILFEDRTLPRIAFFSSLIIFYENNAKKVSLDLMLIDRSSKIRFKVDSEGGWKVFGSFWEVSLDMQDSFEYQIFVK